MPSLSWLVGPCPSPPPVPPHNDWGLGGGVGSAPFKRTALCASRIHDGLGLGPKDPFLRIGQGAFLGRALDRMGWSRCGEELVAWWVSSFRRAILARRCTVWVRLAWPGPSARWRGQRKTSPTRDRHYCDTTATLIRHPTNTNPARIRHRVDISYFLSRRISTQIRQKSTLSMTSIRLYQLRRKYVALSGPYHRSDPREARVPWDPQDQLQRVALRRLRRCS